MKQSKKISNLAELYLLILKKIEEKKFEVLGDLGYTNSMSETDKNKHLAEDYLLSQYLEKTGSMDADKSKPLIDIPELSKDSAATKILKETSLKELTTIVSPEADKSSKWSAVDKDLIAETAKVKVIKEHLTNTNLEINKFGAVYTPYPLIEKMLDKLDKIYKSQHNGESIFTNQDATWLDPSSGSGSFLLVLKERLLKDLKKIVKQLDREKHILNKMLYGSEIQKKQYLISKKILNYKNRPGVEVHIHNGDSLVFDFWGKKFTVVIGNPPYQDAMESGEKKPSNHNLWERFIIKGLDLLEDDGFLVFITPTSWMSPMWKYTEEVFKRYQTHYLEVNTIKDFFPGVGSEFSWYIIQKRPLDSKVKTTIKSKYKNETYDFTGSMSKFNFYPKLISKESVSIMNKFYENDFSKFSFVRDSKIHSSTHKNILSAQQDEEHPYPVQHSASKVLWSSRKHPLQDRNKVLVSRSGYPEAILDEGTKGTTETCLYTLCESKEEAEKKQKLVNSKTFQFIFSICKWSGFNIGEVLSRIPYIDLENYTEEEIMKALKLSKKEIELIEKVVG